MRANELDHRFQYGFKVQKLSIEQGLSQSVVYDTIQDSQGYIWIATESGLNRFDGYNFKIFEHIHSDPHSLHENLIYTLLEEPGIGLWIGTQNGLSFLLILYLITVRKINRILMCSIFVKVISISGFCTFDAMSKIH